MVYHRILNIAFSVKQWDLVVYPLYMLKLTSANPNLPLHPFPQLPHLGNHHSVLYVCDSFSVS